MRAKIVGSLLLVSLSACSSMEAAEYVVRVPLNVSNNQDQIDTLRRDMEDKSMFGGGESRPWNERYLGENPSLPYQGPPTGIPF